MSKVKNYALLAAGFISVVLAMKYVGGFENSYVKDQDSYPIPQFGGDIVPKPFCDRGGLWLTSEVHIGGSISVDVGSTTFVLEYPVEGTHAQLSISTDLETPIHMLPLPIGPDPLRTHHYGRDDDNFPLVKEYVVVVITNLNSQIYPPDLPLPSDISNTNDSQFRVEIQVPAPIDEKGQHTTCSPPDSYPDL